MREDARDARVVEPLVYREEVLTIMTVLGDIRFELEQIHRILGGDDAEEEEEEDT